MNAFLAVLLIVAGFVTLVGGPDLVSWLRRRFERQGDAWWKPRPR